MKYYFSILLVLISFLGSAQKKHYFEANVDLSAPQTKNYFYNNADYSINWVSIKEQGFLLNDYGLNFSYNYLIFKRLSVGTLTGIYSDTKQKFTHIRLGGVLRFFYIKNKMHNFSLKLGQNIALDKQKFKMGVNFKIGLGVPIYELTENKHIMLDLFWEQNFYELDGADKLLGLSDEIPRALVIHAYGLSFNLLF